MPRLYVPCQQNWRFEIFIGNLIYSQNLMGVSYYLWLCEHALLLLTISDIVIVSFFPFPSGGRAYTNFRGSKRILLKVSLIWLYIWIEFQGSGIFFCTRCQFRTKWQPFLLLCRKLFQNIHWQRWFHIWTSTCCVEQVDDWRAKMTNSCSFTPCLYINLVEYDIHVLSLWQALCTFTKFRVSLHTILLFCFRLFFWSCFQFCILFTLILRGPLLVT